MIVIEGQALAELLAVLDHARSTDYPVYKISVDQRADGVAYKVNEFMWTPTLPTR